MADTERDPVRGWTPAQLLTAMRPRGAEWRNVYIVGCYEHRITFYNQQVRALCLVAALAESGALSGKRVAVIGAGAAGCTAALAACHAGAGEAVLFERHRPLHLQAMSDRYLHPHIYDWPADGSPPNPSEPRHAQPGRAEQTSQGSRAWEGVSCGELSGQSRLLARQP